MELSIKTLSIFGAVILTGLSAGLFYAWSVSVIPGTQKVSDSTYLQTMQSVNRAILNPAFFSVFFGSALLLILASFFQYDGDRLAFWLTLSATIMYLGGTIGVTGMGNVPLNDQLDALQLKELNSAKLTEFRLYYESKWNRLHAIRTAFAVGSFALILLAVISQIKIIK